MEILIDCPTCLKKGINNKFEPIIGLSDEVDYDHTIEATDYQCPEGHRLKVVDFL